MAKIVHDGDHGVLLSRNFLRDIWVLPELKLGTTESLARDDRERERRLAKKRTAKSGKAEAKSE